MVPPLVTATTRASRRPSTTSVSRSQTTRGLSSANSSDGYAPASMPSTPSRTSRVRVSYGAAAVTVASRSATVHLSMTVIATNCCARTSSGLRGITVVSIAPSCIRRVTTAHSSRSPRYFGKMTPLLGAPTWCPARPTRWSPRATLVGLSTWITRSTAPMSIPSSRLDVATSAGRRPALSSSSIARRCSRAMLPWWARTSSSPASSLSRWASRSLRRRELVNTIVLRWLRISSRMRGWIAGQMLVRRSAPVAGPPGCWSGGRTSPIAAMSSTGMITWSSSGLRTPASTIWTSRPGPTPAMNRAIASSGRCVADRPIRWGGFASGAREALQPFQAQGEVGSALRAGDRMDLVDDHVLHAPEHLARAAGQHQVERFGRGDQDVRRVAGDLPAVLGRGVAGPRGDGDVRRVVAQPLRCQADPGQRCLQVALDVVGQGLERRDVQDADLGQLALGGWRARLSGKTVQAPQEGCQGLAAAGRRVDQGVPAGRDGCPTLGLGRGGCFEAGSEPFADRGREALERVDEGARGDPGVAVVGHRASRRASGSRRGSHGMVSIGGTAALDQMC